VVQLTTNARREAAVAQAEINQLKQREQVLLESAKQVQQSYTADQQQALPAAHELVDRKAFLWSRLLADLESSDLLPSDLDAAARATVRREWDCFALYACVRGLVAAGIILVLGGFTYFIVSTVISPRNGHWDNVTGDKIASPDRGRCGPRMSAPNAWIIASASTRRPGSRTRR